MTKASTIVLVFGAVLAALLSGNPLPVAASEPVSDPLIAEAIDQVQPAAVSAIAGGLTGEWPVLVGGHPDRILTRSTYETLSIQNATQHVFEQLQALGLQVSFDDWASGSSSGRNVIGELPGDSLADEIILLTAHLDDSPWYGLAPGANDNASGCTAVLLAAHILSQYRFARTLRFVFFTGEEQGLKGSRHYASLLAATQANVTAVLNMDMIGWRSQPYSILRLHTRSIYSPEYLSDAMIAAEVMRVVDAYGLGDAITPVIDADGANNSDQASFWAVHYPAIHISEDLRDDPYPYYHSTGDRLARLDLPYFTAGVKAVVGSAAQLAQIQGWGGSDDAARFDPPAIQHWAEPGETVTYTLRLTNLGPTPDTYTFTTANNLWPISTPSITASVPPASGVDVTVTVGVPPDGMGGAADIATVALVSQSAGRALDFVTLYTVVNWRMAYLPVIQR